MKNSKVYGIIMSLEWILKTHILQYLLKWNFDLDSWSTDRVWYRDFFMKTIGCPKANVGLLHLQGDSLAYSMVITGFYLILSKGNWKPRKEVGSQSLVGHIFRV